MSLKRVLGMMLASRMAGRGRRRGGFGGGLGGGLGTAAMLGGLGRRRGMGGKLGLAAMGYMAYQAYQDHQRRTAGSTAGSTGTGTGTGSAVTGGSGARPSGGSGGIGDMIRNVADHVDRVTGGAISGGAGAAGGPASGAQADPGGADFGQEEQRAAAEFSEDKALLLLRAMIAAAYSDGALSQDERARIMGEIEEAGGDAEDRRTMEREIANPRPVDELLAQVNDKETAEEFYLASRAAVDAETEQNRAYLARLRERLGLTEQEAAEVEEIAS